MGRNEECGASGGGTSGEIGGGGGGTAVTLGCLQTMEKNRNVETGRGERARGAGERVKPFCTGAASRVCRAQVVHRPGAGTALSGSGFKAVHVHGEGRAIPAGCSRRCGGVSKPGVQAEAWGSCQARCLETVLLSRWDPWQLPRGSGGFFSLPPSPGLDSSSAEQKKSLITSWSEDLSDPFSHGGDEVWARALGGKAKAEG